MALFYTQYSVQFLPGLEIFFHTACPANCIKSTKLPS